MVSSSNDFEDEKGAGEYKASPAELAGLDRGLRDSAEGKFASAEDVEKALRKLRQ